MAKSAERNSLPNSNYGAISDSVNDRNCFSPVNEHNSADALITSDLLINKQLKSKIWRNLWIFNGAVFIQVMGFAPIVMIQSSFNSADGLGVASMAVNYASMIISNFFVPSIMRKTGCKWALVFGIALQATYNAANFYPAFYTLLPMAILGGLGSTMFGISSKVYLSKIAHLYSDIANMEPDRIGARIFVLEICIGTVSAAISSVISSLILNAGVDNNALGSNYTNPQLSICGVNYCNEELEMSAFVGSYNEPEFKFQTQRNVYWLVGFSTAMTIMGALFMAFVSPLQKFRILPGTEQSHTSPLATLKDMLKAIRDPKQLLFIPIAMALNGGDAFWIAEYTLAFISCSIGMTYLGFVGVWECLSGFFSTLLFGWFNSKKMRYVPIVSTTLLQLVSLTAIFYWYPSNYTMIQNYWILTIIAVVYMFGSGIRRFISPVLVAVVFKDNLETAFSVYNLWSNTVSMLFFAWSTGICIRVKLYILISAIALSLFCYIGIYILANLKAKNSQKCHLLNSSNGTNSK